MYFHTRFHCTPLARQTLTCVLWLFYKKEFLQLLHDVEAVQSLELQYLVQVEGNLGYKKQEKEITCWIQFYL